MAQQIPPNGGRGGPPGRGPSTAGRGPGRGAGGSSQHQPPPYNNYSAGGSGRGATRPAMAWQPSQPTSSLQQAAAYQGVAPPQPSQSRPVPAGGYNMHATPGMPYYSNPYAGAGAPMYNPRGDAGQWQGQQHYAHQPHPQMGGVYYPQTAGPPVVNPNAPVPISRTQAPHAIAPREKKPLLITDKHGNVVDLSTPKVNSSLQAAAKAPTPKADAPAAGSNLREAALERIKAKAAEETKNGVEKKEIVHTTKTSDVESITTEVVAEKGKEDALIVDNLKQIDEEDSSDKKVKVLNVEIVSEKVAKTSVENAEIKSVEISKVNNSNAVVEEKGQNEPSSSLASAVAAENVPVASPVVEQLSNMEITVKRIVFPKELLVSFQNEPQCSIRPSGLPDMSIARGQSQNKAVAGVGGGGVVGGTGAGGTSSGARNKGNRENSGGNWERGNAGPRRQSSQGDKNDRSGGGSGDTGNDWSRGQNPPRQQNQNQKGRGGGGGGGGGGRGSGGRHGHQQAFLYNGPVAPLVKSENHWRPVKNTSAFVVAEKKVKAILNKMTKEKFDRLSDQMLEIPIISFEMLTMMIDNVYDKAIDEPSFGDIYSDLCVRLSQSVKVSEFIHIVESDEEPPTEDGSSAPDTGESSNHTVYRWSNDVSTSDAEIVGPLSSIESCISAAHNEIEMEPIERGEMELELVSVVIKRRIFIKIMKKKNVGHDENIYYTVFFPASEAEQCGQYLSPIFLSQVECESDSSKKNNFKRVLLNKCEEEFNKNDIYADWKKEKADYESSKSKVSEAERREKEDELKFRRIRIKKQMLGNIKFIGQLFKKNLLKEKVLRFCVGELLKLEIIPAAEGVKAKVKEYRDTGNTEDIDEEDHEAICSLFATIGSTIDKPQSSEFMTLCFNKIRKLSDNFQLPSRTRFMYKDLIELRSSGWVPRRKEEKAKTIAEIRKEVELEERKQAEESARANRGGGGGATDYRNKDRNNSSDVRSSANRNLSVPALRAKPQKPSNQVDDDGFMTPYSGKNSSVRAPVGKSVVPRTQQNVSKAQSSPGPAPLSDDRLERLIKCMRSDFMSGGGDVKELLLTYEEISGTPGHAKTLIVANCDKLFESKEEERNAITKILVILCEKGKLSKDDIQNGVMGSIEFIDDILPDSPRAYEYLGELLGEMLRLKALDVGWFCTQLEKVSPTAQEKLIRYAAQVLKKSGGESFKQLFAHKDLITLLGVEKSKTIQNNL